MRRKRKMILLSIVAALILVMAFSASAFAAGEAFSTGISKSADSVKVGDTVSFTVNFNVSGGSMAGFQAGVTASSNLQFVSAAKSGSYSLNADPQESGLVIEGNRTQAVAAGGSASVTYQYKVLSGTSASFAFTNVKGFDAEGNAVAYAGGNPSASVSVTETPVPTPTPDQPGTEPTGEPTAAPTTAPETDSKLDKVPKTGDATTDIIVFAVIALAAAGTIGAVAGKKAFSK